MTTARQLRGENIACFNYCSSGTAQVGERCAVGCDGGILAVYKLSAARPLEEVWRWEHKTAEGGTLKVGALAYSPDGELLADAVVLSEEEQQLVEVALVQRGLNR